jgi:hypothetical protein
MIFQTPPPDLQAWINALSDSGASILLVISIYTLIVVYAEMYRRGGFLYHKFESPVEPKLSWLVKFILYVGIFVGVFGIMVGVLTIWLSQPPSHAYLVKYGDHWDPLTSVLLCVMGVILLFQPLKDVPWIALLGFVAGITAGILIVSVIPSSWLVYLQLQTNLNWQWLYIVIFLVIATLIGLAVKFWFTGLEMISKILSWPPIALILGIYCFIQALNLLLYGNTLYLL